MAGMARAVGVTLMGAQKIAWKESKFSFAVC